MIQRSAMYSPFKTGSYEPSRFVAFTGNKLDRLSEKRAADCVEKAFGRSDAKALVAADGRFLIKPTDADAQPLFAATELESLGVDRSAAVLLGYAADRSPRLIVPSTLDPDALPANLTAVSFRSVFSEGILSPDLLGEFAQGVSLLAWNQSCRFCGFCGVATRTLDGGYRRRCPSCERMFFPRSDPAVIMLVVDEVRDRCLLGRSPHFRLGIHSCLSGFVEPGETIEAAVRRETCEEAGIAVGRVAYHASQPWPFPHSLMIGCYGEALTQTIRREEAELESCRWFDRTELQHELTNSLETEYELPNHGSIAYRLIHDWAVSAKNTV